MNRKPTIKMKKFLRIVSEKIYKRYPMLNDQSYVENVKRIKNCRKKNYYICRTHSPNFTFLIPTMTIKIAKRDQIYAIA